MHSRIFQVSSKPIEDFITEERYYDGFVGEHADYVATVESETDLIEDLKWLGNREGLSVDLDKKTVTITSKRDYFDEKFDEFKDLLEELKNMTTDEFIEGKFDLKMYDLNGAYENEHGFYIDDSDDYMGLSNIDYWVRNAEENKPYYIGSVFDYHF